MSRAKRARRGFSLLETISAVAILVVLMAVSFPHVIMLRNSLDMQRLDDTAKQIYLSAQTTLTRLQATARLAGALDDLTQSPTTKEEAHYAGQVPDGVQLAYVVKGDAGSNELINADDTGITNGDTAGHNWLIVLSPYTGDVASVYYTDASADSFDLETAVRRLSGTSRPDRTRDRIGYYEGGVLENVTSASVVPSPSPSEPEQEHESPGADPLENPSVEVENREDLYVQIKAEDKHALWSTADLSKLKIVVEVTGPIDQNTGYGEGIVTLTYEGDEIRRLGVGSDEIDVVLDSMRKGESFAEIIGSKDAMRYQNWDNSWVKAGHIAVGANIKVHVALYYDDMQAPYREIWTECNSLFGSLREEQENGQPTHVATVGCLRHLSNLGTQMSHSPQYVFINKAVQTEDIYFRGGPWDNPETVATRGRAGGQAVNSLWNEPGYFTPLNTTQDNAPDHGFFGNGGSTFDGGNHKIYNMVIGDKNNPGDYVGLFARTDANIKNVHLVDATVYGKYRVGTLAGQVRNTGEAITNCSAKTTPVNGELPSETGVFGQDEVGGLVGFMNTEGISDCWASVNVGGNDYVGGLIGRVGMNDGDIATMSSCSVRPVMLKFDDGSLRPAIPQVKGNDNVGGLAGKLSAKTKDCYVTANVSGHRYVGGFCGFGTNLGECTDCDVRAATQKVGSDVTEGVMPEVHGTADHVGGFAGWIGGGSGAKPTRCYVQANVTGTRDVGGFAGESSNAEFSRCHVEGVQRGMKSSTEGIYPRIKGEARVGGFVGNANMSSKFIGCYAASEVGPAQGGGSLEGAGGFLGLIGENSTVNRCFASGSVEASSSAGGFVAQATTTSLYNSYTTSNVRCDAEAGGFAFYLGKDYSMTNLAAYGRVTGRDGRTVKENDGFVFATEASIKDFLGWYLRESGYNDELANHANALAWTHDQMVENVTPFESGKSHPYAKTLQGQRFPFADMTGMGFHVGDWPVR